jgi:hypothetical protein
MTLMTDDSGTGDAVKEPGSDVVSSLDSVSEITVELETNRA